MNYDDYELKESDFVSVYSYDNKRQGDVICQESEYTEDNWSFLFGENADPRPDHSGKMYAKRTFVERTGAPRRIVGVNFYKKKLDENGNVIGDEFCCSYNSANFIAEAGFMDYSGGIKTIEEKNSDDLKEKHDNQEHHGNKYGSIYGWGR